MINTCKLLNSSDDYRCHNERNLYIRKSMKKISQNNIKPGNSVIIGNNETDINKLLIGIVEKKNDCFYTVLHALKPIIGRSITNIIKHSLDMGLYGIYDEKIKWANKLMNKFIGYGILVDLEGYHIIHLLEGEISRDYTKNILVNEKLQPWFLDEYNIIPVVFIQEKIHFKKTKSCGEKFKYHGIIL